MPVHNKAKAQVGFTLIEIVAGIVVLSISLMIMTGALFPQARESTNPWFQVRSAELAQSFMNEILGKRFDENSPLVSGSPLCDEDATACTDLTVDCPVTTRAEEDIVGGDYNRHLYDDVDDYHCFSATGDELKNLENSLDLDDVYKEFNVSVTVVYAGSDLSLDDNRKAKRITVTVTAPNNQVIRYAAYRTNY